MTNIPTIRSAKNDATELSLDTSNVSWIPTGLGRSFRPIRFWAGGWSELMRLEPGSVVGRHRHTGAVSAFNLHGHRELHGSGEIIGPHTFVHEPEGNIDSWRAIGNDPCIVHFHILGTVEYLDSDDTVTGYADTATQHGVYLDWCAQHNIVPAPQLAMMPS
jgi:2,4'-dihydroxyacetophenone dioxygenase